MKGISRRLDFDVILKQYLNYKNVVGDILSQPSGYADNLLLNNFVLYRQSFWLWIDC